MTMILIVLLLAWFLTGRTLSDLQTLGRRGLAWAADKVADTADRRAHRAPWLAGHVARMARSGALRLRDRRSPMQPRTSDGQRVFDGAGQVAAAGAVLLLVWVRIVVADAYGAAQAAAQPRATTSTGRWSWASGWVTWARWPREGEPHAPVRATATRTDRPEPLALPPAASGGGSSTAFTTHWRTR
ncbi:hypothetical protein PV646_28630 [Streptomyces sp. ID05-26A]|nr:hypothetical protein [Streptomyces sp. ID05-26A]